MPDLPAFHGWTHRPKSEGGTDPIGPSVTRWCRYYVNRGTCTHTQASATYEGPNDYASTGTLVSNFGTNAPNVFTTLGRHRITIDPDHIYAVSAFVALNRPTAANATLKIRIFRYSSGGSLLATSDLLGFHGLTRAGFIPSTDTTINALSITWSIFESTFGLSAGDTVEIEPSVLFSAANDFVIDWRMYLLDLGLSSAVSLIL